MWSVCLPGTFFSRCFGELPWQRRGRGKVPSDHNSPIFPGATYHARHCKPVTDVTGLQSVSLVPPWLPLWGSCHEVTERVKNALSAPLGHLSHRERQVALIRLALAGDVRATFTLWSNCHRQLLDFNSLRGAPLVRNDIWFSVLLYKNRTIPSGTQWRDDY